MKYHHHTPHALEHISRLTPYIPGMAAETLVRQSGLSLASISTLASNENPFGMSPKARRALRQTAEHAHLYPDGYALRQALATHHGLTPECVILGNGSNDVLDLIARTYLGPGIEAVSAQYAFAIYEIATQTAGGINVIAPAAPNLGHDLHTMLEAITPATRLVWIANPNNPTGTFIPYSEILTFIDTIPKDAIVVLDEAYYEYLPPNEQTRTVEWLASRPNLMLIRTFSKIYGLAGLRIGYGLGDPEVVKLLDTVRQPFNTSTVALAAAVSALGDQDFVERNYHRNRRGLRQLESGFRRLGIEYLPSIANFVTAKLPPSAYTAMLNAGIITRPLAAYGLPDYLRITIGRPAENTRILQVLEQQFSASHPSTNSK